MTTTKPPVLTDETTAILESIVKQADDAKEQCGPDPESATAIRNSKLASIANAAAQALGMVRGPSYIKQAVLERAGADAVRDAALSENLHTFLNAAAGEGVMFDAIGADDLYVALFPERYAAAVSGIDTGVGALKVTPAAAVAGCGCSEFEREHCRGAASPYAEHPDCARAAAVADPREPWLLYLADRADGVAGRYAIARWNPEGYREVWNRRIHRWAAFSDEVLSLEEARALLRDLVIPTAPQSSGNPGPLAAVESAVMNLDRYKETSAEGGGVYETSDGDFIKLSEVVAAIAASKGANHG